jgi:hypothetical protein
MPENTTNSFSFKTRYPDSTEPDANVAVSFLMDVADGGLITMVMIPVRGGARAMSFDTSDAGEVEALRSLLRYEETQPHNVFYVPNRTIGKPGAHEVPDRGDIDMIRDLVFDFDPDKSKPLEQERMRLRELAHKLLLGATPPRTIIDTGGGMQIRFKLSRPIAITHENRQAVTEEIESLMRRLARRLGADTATNTIKNLFRGPGSKNWPTEAKRKAGREISFSGLWHVGFGETTLEELQALCVTTPEDDPTNVKEVDLGGVNEAAMVEVLGHPERLEHRLKDLVQSKPGLAAAVRRPDMKALDTSGEDHELCMALARHKLSPGDMALLLAAYGAKVHKAHHQEHRLFSYVRTTVSKAWGLVNAVLDFVDDSTIDEEQAAKDREAAAAKEQERFDRFKPLTWEEFQALHRDRKPALIDGLLGRQEMSVVYGESGSGKTFIVLDLGVRIANGMMVLGRGTTRCAVVYIAAESPAGVTGRWKALIQEYGPTPDFYAISAAPNLFDAKAGDLDAVGKQIAALRGQDGKRVDVGLIIIDTLARVMIGGNENSTEDMSLLVANGDKLRDAFKCNVMWVHHSGKDRSLGARGSSALRAATDTEIEIHDNIFDVTKLRNDSAFKHKFELKTGIVVGEKLDGSPLTSCVVQWTEGSFGGGDRPRPEAELRDHILFLLRKAGKPMTLRDIMAAAELEGIKLPASNTIRMLLTRSIEDQKQRFFKVVGEEPTGIGKNVAKLYGLFDE